MNSSKKGCVFFDTKNGVMQGDWGFTVTNMTMIFFSKHILGICGTSVKGSHPLEFIQHKKRQA